MSQEATTTDADALIRSSAMNASRLSIDELSPRRFGLNGVLDTHTADSLASTIDSCDAVADLQLDMTGVEFIDSSGLRTIVSAHHRFEEAGRRLVLVGTSESVDLLFGLTGLRDHLHIDA